MANKETRELIQFVVALSSGLGRALADGKIGVTDFLAFTEAFRTANAALENIGGVVPELRQLSEADRAALMRDIEALDLPIEAVEVVAEKALKAGILLAELAVGFIPTRKAG